MKTMQSELIAWASINNMKISKIKSDKQENKKKSQNGMSEREIKELMGVYRPTYKRVRGGALRQK